MAAGYPSLVQLFQEQETSQEQQTWKHHLRKAGPVGAGDKLKHRRAGARRESSIETRERRVIQLDPHQKSRLAHDPRKRLTEQESRVLSCGTGRLLRPPLAKLSYRKNQGLRGKL